jgi:hypothetical protein
MAKWFAYPLTARYTLPDGPLEFYRFGESSPVKQEDLSKVPYTKEQLIEIDLDLIGS